MLRSEKTFSALMEWVYKKQRGKKTYLYENIEILKKKLQKL